MAEATSKSAEQLVSLLKVATNENVGISSQEALEPMAARPGRVVLNRSHVLPGTNTFRAFVATDSNSPFIFATLAETSGVPNATIYCGPRNYGSRDGILITIFVQGQIPNDVVEIVTLMQDRARGYALPVLYTGV
jgi:hypothetical protein